MRQSRWLAPSFEKPCIYHLVSRVVDRRFVLGETEREHFQIMMRMYGNLSTGPVVSERIKVFFLIYFEAGFVTV